MTDAMATGGVAAGLGRVDKPLFAITGGFIALFCAVGTLGHRPAVQHGRSGIPVFSHLFRPFLAGSAACDLSDRSRALPSAGGGGVLWAASEPTAHCLSHPPVFGDLSGDPLTRGHAARDQNFLRRGFLAWAILVTLATVMRMHCHHGKGLPLAPRTFLCPLFKDRAIHGPIGVIADASCIIAVVAGIALEQSNPSVIADPFEDFTLPAGLLAFTQAIPLGFVLSLLFLVLTRIFVATTGDSMRYVISNSMSKGDPSTRLRAFCGLVTSSPPYHCRWCCCYRSGTRCASR